jgi:DNA replication protein DnaC
MSTRWKGFPQKEPSLRRACRQGYSALYVRLPRLLDELAQGRGDGRYSKLLAQLGKVDVLLLDDWGLGCSR